MLRRHMFFNGCIAIGCSDSFVEGKALIVVEDFNHRIAVDDRDLLGAVAIGNAVMVLVL